jgi:hypothetical protein
MKTLPLLVALLLSIAACSSDASPGTIPVEGYVHAGPVCPVLQDPPDPNCADRPVAGAQLRVLDSSGNEVAVVTTSTDGVFGLLLSPGSYTLEPLPVEGLLGTAGSQGFRVGSDRVVLDIAYDTGIR